MTVRNRDYPYAAEDLRRIADQVDEVVSALDGIDLDGPQDWKWGLTVDILDVGDTRVGQIKPYGDGWLGFYPVEVES